MSDGMVVSAGGVGAVVRIDRNGAPISRWSSVRKKRSPDRRVITPLLRGFPREVCPEAFPGTRSTDLHNQVCTTPCLKANRIDKKMPGTR